MKKKKKTSNFTNEFFFINYSSCQCGSLGYDIGRYVTYNLIQNDLENILKYAEHRNEG